jgi:hypothetical protein
VHHLHVSSHLAIQAINRFSLDMLQTSSQHRLRQLGTVQFPTVNDTSIATVQISDIGMILAQFTAESPKIWCDQRSL